MIRPTHAVIHPDALHQNLRLLRSRLSPGTDIMAVVKADCYGHGAALCIPEMVDEGVMRFAVATVEEAGALRAMGIGQRITVLAPPLEGQYADFIDLDLEPLISNISTAEHLSRCATALGRSVRAHLFVDTGMARNGMPPEDVVESLRYMSALEAVEIIGFSSHFACSDEPDNPFNRQQITGFDAALRCALDAGFNFADIHLANSGGILNFPDSHYSLVRPGLALYGYHPTVQRQQESALQPVMTLHTVVSNVWQMPAHRSISYGRRFYTATDTVIASIPIGYADGLMRVLTNRLDVLIAGRRYPVVGTICMDEVMVELGNGTDIGVGDEVIIIGHQQGESINAWELATAAGTIPYEICTNISVRVPRIHEHDPNIQSQARTGTLE